jgi:hypothetical protein
MAVCLDSLALEEGDQDPLTLSDLTERSRTTKKSVVSVETFLKMWGKGVEFITVDGEIPSLDIQAEFSVMNISAEQRMEVVYYEDDIEEDQQVRRIRTRQHGAYTSYLLRKLREKFVWDLTELNATNKACIHHHAVQLMKQDGLRLHDRDLILRTIVRKFFTPLRRDIEEAEAMNSYAMHRLRLEATAVRVDHGWQRWWRFGARAPVAPPTSQ